MTTPPLPPGEPPVPDEPGGQGVAGPDANAVNHRDKPTSESVAVVLAIGISTALNVICIAMLIAAWHRLGIDEDSGLSENAVQLLLAWGGGIISILAAYVGYAFGRRRPPGD